jgi:hypothetical protein
VDYSSAYNDFGGLHNALNYLNNYAFATLKDDGSITAWGASWAGGTSAPSDNGYTKIYSTATAFAALKAAIKPLEQVKIVWLMLEIDCPAHQHGQKTYSVAI